MRAILGRNVTTSGFVIAGIGFFLTRFTVALVIGDPVEFLFAGLLPLVLGLLLAAFGVALAVGSFTARFTNTVAMWTVIGAGSMAVLVVSTVMGAGMGMRTIQPGPVFSNFLIGGGVGGAMVGVYAGLNKQNREELRQQANRLATLNRILRDQVLNAVTVIKGHVAVLEDRHSERSVSVIATQSEAIETSIDDVGYLTRTTGNGGRSIRPVDLGTHIDTALDQARDRHPGASFSFDTPVDVEVCADQRLGHVFFHLLDNAARYTEDPEVRIEVDVDPQTVTIRVIDDGPGLPESEQATLEAGDITEFDDPRSGFGLNMVRLLVESYDGLVRADVDEGGTTVAVELVRGEQGIPVDIGGVGAVRSYGVPPQRLVAAIGAAILAGLVMGGVMQAIAGIVPVIGALYGVRDVLVGWITHEFHSIVFGMVYASLVAAAPRRVQEFRGHLAIAIAFALFLWAFAAGVVMPFWLQLLGIPASLPNLTGTALLGHLVWGVTLGTSYHLITTRLQPEA